MAALPVLALVEAAPLPFEDAPRLVWLLVLPALVLLPPEALLVWLSVPPLPALVAGSLAVTIALEAVLAPVPTS